MMQRTGMTGHTYPQQGGTASSYSFTDECSPPMESASPVYGDVLIPVIQKDKDSKRNTEGRSKMTGHKRIQPESKAGIVLGITAALLASVARAQAPQPK